MFQYYNANPLQRKVSDCSVRALSKAEDITWDDAYLILSEFARAQCIMPDEIEYIDDFLQRRYFKMCGCKGRKLIVGEFVNKFPNGTYLITMSGHITCASNGVIYDTFDPSDRFVWDVYLVRE